MVATTAAALDQLRAPFSDKVVVGWGLCPIFMDSEQMALKALRLFNANAKEDADVYRALKGGGSNYGSISKFILSLTSNTPSTSTTQTTTSKSSRQLGVQEVMENDNKIGLFSNSNQGVIAVGLLYADTPTERPPAFEPFYNLTSLMTIVFPV
ncbi:hypothetical protein PISL3812_06324 [Talaromyces islandicus]|uniref:Uncharacterized protein n=1 Tax=Talaromyces islandicus TaxID=28573 RepID=A0A0U1M133_TALIS|nr:hypothetical protein PISL3812_06324 [Talaromyces islandicus]